MVSSYRTMHPVKAEGIKGIKMVSIIAEAIRFPNSIIADIVDQARYAHQLSDIVFMNGDVS